MTKKRHILALVTGYSAIIGCIIGIVTWLYLRASTAGINLIWNVIGPHFPEIPFTLIVCLAGGVCVGLFQKKFGPYPENMSSAVRRVLQDHYYPYRKFPIIVVAALLPLFFGGAVGPEAGLVSILLCFCIWAREQFGMGRQFLMRSFDEDPDVSGVVVFFRLLRGLVTHPPRVEYEQGKVPWTRPMQIGTGVACGLGGLFFYVLFYYCFGASLTLPHIDPGETFSLHWFYVFILLGVGIGAGYLYLILHKWIAKFFALLRGKGFHVLNAVLCGLILALIGTQIPGTMFSGATSIQAMQIGAETVPYLLIAAGLLKLFLTNVCIESGWRGGHFFPLLFAGLSLGYGFAAILGANEIMSVVIVAGALLGTALQQPIGALALSVIFFPLRAFGWMVLATFVCGSIPIPKAIRQDPDNKGFIYNTIHRKDRKRISSEEPGEETT